MSWDWFNTGAGAASLVGLLVTLGSVISGWHLTRLRADIHAATQATLTDLRQGFTESQERMDARWREAFERLDQRADERHREALDAIQALKR